MIDKFQFDPVDGLQNATAYPDDPGNEEAFREQLQRPLNQVKDFVNSLVDAYAKTEAGRSGAEEIGSEAISGLMDPSNPLQPALTVRKQLQAAQKNIDDIIAGIIPDGSVNTEKIADGAVTPDKVSGGVGCNYIRNRIPTTGDNFNLGYKAGDTWTVPDMTLNNLIPHATAITPADWILQNGSLTGSGSKGTLTCGNGLESTTAKINVAPIPGHVYALFGALKVTSANVITSISLGADQKTAPVKDAAYNLCEIITAPTEFKIQITAASAAALNGATVEFDKVCIVDMTADMVGVPFDRAGAIEYFGSHAAFISQEPEYVGMHWYCKGSGVWQSSSQLSADTAEIYNLKTVDEVLFSKIELSSYIAFAGNANDRQVCSAFVPAKENEFTNKRLFLGYQVAKYLKEFKTDITLTEEEIALLSAKNDWYEICNDINTRNIVSRSSSFITTVNAIPFAKYVYENYPYTVKLQTIINSINALCSKSYTVNDFANIKKNQVDMNKIMKDKGICEQVRQFRKAEELWFGVNGENLEILSGSGTFTVPSGVNTLNFVMVGNGVNQTTAGNILSGSLTVSPLQQLAYSIGIPTTFGSLTTASGSVISDTNCSILGRASKGATPKGGVAGAGYGQGGAGGLWSSGSWHAGGGGGGFGAGNGLGNGDAQGIGYGGSNFLAIGSGIANQSNGGVPGVEFGEIINFADSLIKIQTYRDVGYLASVLAKRTKEKGIFGGAGGGKSGTGALGGAGASGVPSETPAPGVIYVFW